MKTTNSLLLKANAQRFTQLERSQFTLTSYLKEAFSSSAWFFQEKPGKLKGLFFILLCV